MAEPTREQDSRLNRLRLPAVLLLAFLLMAGAYYALHYRTNAEYLANRNFRLLATLATQVTEAVRNEGLVFGNVVGPSQEPSGTESLDLEKLSPRIKVSTCAALAHPQPDQSTDKFKLWRTLDASDGTYRLSFQSKREGEEELSHCGEVKLQDLLDPLFSSREAFDAVLLANSAGKVVYLHGPKSLRVEQLDLMIQNRHDVKVDPGKDGKGDDHGFNAFQGYSGSAEVKLGGRFYTTFVQPFGLSLAPAKTASNRNLRTSGSSPAWSPRTSWRRKAWRSRRLPWRSCWGSCCSRRWPGRSPSSSCSASGSGSRRRTCCSWPCAASWVSRSRPCSFSTSGSIEP